MFCCTEKIDTLYNFQSACQYSVNMFENSESDVISTGIFLDRAEKKIEWLPILKYIIARFIRVSKTVAFII